MTDCRAPRHAEPAEPCCPTELTTFTGAHLECERDLGHTGLHLDVDQGVWWASSEFGPVTADGFVMKP